MTNLKPILRETLQHFKSNWMKLMLMSAVGYLLPLGGACGLQLCFFQKIWMIVRRVLWLQCLSNCFWLLG